MSDLQAKYNALLRKFIGDSTLAIDGDTENELAKDIAAAMKEKARRHAEIASMSQAAQAAGFLIKSIAHYQNTGELSK